MARKALLLAVLVCVLAAAPPSAPLQVAAQATAAESVVEKGIAQKLRFRALYAEGRNAEARALAEEALAFAKDYFGDDDPTTAWWQSALGAVHNEEGHFARAEPLLAHAHATLRRLLGDVDWDTLEALLRLAEAYTGLGRFADAESAFKRAIATLEKLPDDRGYLAMAYNNLAKLYRDAERFAEAEDYYKRALARAERTEGSDSEVFAIALSNLANVYAEQERFAEAEALLKRALAVKERKLGPSHPGIGRVLGNLGTLYVKQERYAEAEPLLKRAAAILETALGPQHLELAAALDNLAGLYLKTKRPAEAERLYRRVLAIQERYPEDARGLAGTLNNLALVLLDMRQEAAAEQMLRRALALIERGIGPDTLRAAAILGQLAFIDFTKGRYAEAAAGLRREIAILRKTFHAQHSVLGDALIKLSMTLTLMGDIDGAFAAARESAAIAAATKQSPVRPPLGEFERTAQAFDLPFVHTVHTAYRLARRRPGEEPRLREEAWNAAQHVAFDDTGRAAMVAASRFKTRDDALGRLLREQQDLFRRLPAADQALADALGAASETARAKAAILRRETDAIVARLQAIDAQLRREQPAYADLVDPKPVGIAETQRLLRADEAVLMHLVGYDEIYLFAVSKTAIAWAGIEMRREELARAVARLRTQMSLDSYMFTGAFDRTLAYGLYRDLWAPVESVLQGKRVFVIETGALTSLPLAVLVTSPPEGGAAADADPSALRATDWLVKRYALATLPSISSLKALRAGSGTGSGSEPFAGFGDPQFGPLLEANARRRGFDPGRLFKGGDIMLEQLRTLSPLPHTAGELRAIARALGASETNDVFLRDRATEREIKGRDLSRKRVIAFATHGAIAGDLGMAEPGLIFTPPAAASEMDDGYLSASEAARLNLRADWIILSACSTAAGEMPGANGLSGLARGFFFAGARSLLVSHWDVWDDAAMRITTAAVANAAGAPEKGRAEALRQSMLSLMTDKSDVRYAHPAAWAPFVLVGDTGR